MIGPNDQVIIINFEDGNGSVRTENGKPCLIYTLAEKTLLQVNS